MQASSSERKLGYFAKFVLTLCVAIMVAATVNGSSIKSPVKTGGTALFSSPVFVESAKELYDGKCARCHGADGRGDTVIGRSLDAPDFTDVNWKKRHSAREMVSIVSSGHKGMPAFEKKLTRRQIASLVAYVRIFK